MCQKELLLIGIVSLALARTEISRQIIRHVENWIRNDQRKTKMEVWEQSDSKVAASCNDDLQKNQKL